MVRARSQQKNKGYGKQQQRKTSAENSSSWTVRDRHDPRRAGERDYGEDGAISSASPAQL